MLAAGNRELNALIRDYERRSYKLEKFLSPYFSETQIPQFRSLQLQTGMLISGSTALQFFLRTPWAGSDLDLYVECQYVPDVSHFLLDCGYTHEPYEGQIQNAFHQNIRNPAYYSGRGIRTVFNFQKGGVYIQIIVASTSAMHSVLSFHSSRCFISLRGKPILIPFISDRNECHNTSPCNLPIPPRNLGPQERRYQQPRGE
jgi:hypothetical protein